MHLFEKKKGEKYDAIIGWDLMIKLGIVWDYKEEHFAWGRIEISMLIMGYWAPSAIKKFRRQPEKNYTIVKDAEYKQPDLNDVADAQTHLKESQRNILLHVLKKHHTIFKAKRGNWLGQDVDIKLKSDVIPSRARTCRVTDAYE